MPVVLFGKLPFPERLGKYRDFFAILGRGPRAFQVGKISTVNPYFGKFSKQTRTAFLVSL